MTVLEHTAETGIEPTPALKYLRRAWPAIPSFALREALKRKDLRINGRRSGAEATVRAGDALRLYIDEKYTQSSLRVLFEGAGLLCVEKPQGLPVDADEAGVGADTLLARARAMYPGARLCHRLDAGTGGAILLATGEETYKAVLAAFRERTIGKTYALAVFGAPPQAEGSLVGYIAREEGKARVRVYDEPHAGAKIARTDYRLLDTRQVGGRTVSFLEADIHTGRTHQIRAQMARAGCPLAGDDKYGDRESNAALHARMPALWCRRLVLPETGLPERLRGLRIESVPRFPLWKELARY